MTCRVIIVIGVILALACPGFGQGFTLNAQEEGRVLQSLSRAESAPHFARRLDQQLINILKLGTGRRAQGRKMKAVDALVYFLITPEGLDFLNRLSGDEYIQLMSKVKILILSMPTSEWQTTRFGEFYGQLVQAWSTALKVDEVEHYRKFLFIAETYSVKVPDEEVMRYSNKIIFSAGFLRVVGRVHGAREYIQNGMNSLVGRRKTPITIEEQNTLATLTRVFKIFPPVVPVRRTIASWERSSVNVTKQVPLQRRLTTFEKTLFWCSEFLRSLFDRRYRESLLLPKN